MNKEETKSKDWMIEVLEEYFNRGVDKKKFIDVNRIPLICQDISEIHTTLQEIKSAQEQSQKNISEMQDNFKWGVRLVLGAVVLGLVALLFK